MTKTVKIALGPLTSIAFFRGYLYWSDNHSRTSEIANLAPMSADCGMVIQRRPDGGAIIERPKHHCLSASLTIEGQYNRITPEGPKYFSKDEIGLLVASDDITLDFRGHLARSRANDVAGVVEGARISLRDTDYGTFGDPRYAREDWAGFNKNITVKNGRVEVQYGGMGLYFPGDAGWYVRELIGRSREPATDGSSTLTTDQKRKVHYSAYNVDRNIVIDTMNIRSKDPGILIQGGRTVIRNSIIETDDTTGIWVFGSNAIIEGNTIIVHRAESSWWDVYGAIKRGAPIRLVYADGAIIRNNRIVIKGFTKGSAVSITDSKSVIFENNRIYGMNSESPWVATYDGAEEPHAANTIFEPGWKAWFIGWGF